MDKLKILKVDSFIPSKLVNEVCYILLRKNKVSNIEITNYITEVTQIDINIGVT